VGQLIHVDEQLRLGRSEVGDGALGGDDSLSDTHAELRRDHAGDWMVHDLGSERGTYLNGQPLLSIEQLHRGDSLRLGSSRLLVVEGRMRAPRPRPPAPPAVGAGPPALAFTSRDVVEPPAPVVAPPVLTRPQQRVAPLRRRWRALVIDHIVLLPFVLGLAYLFGGALVAGLAALALTLVYDFLFESLRGQTIGKRAMKLRVVRRDGSPLRPQHCAARNVLRFIDTVPGIPLIGLLSITATGKERRQRLGDLAAGTMVVEAAAPSRAKLPAARRDRLILAAYPATWIAPVVAFALLNPSAAAKSCLQAGITTLEAKEGTCVQAGADGQARLATYVDAGHTLHWSGYDISLVRTRVHRLRRPHNVFVVGVKLAVTNRHSTTAHFDRRSVRVALNFPYLGVVRTSPQLSTRVHIRRLRPFDSHHGIAPGATRVAWVRFLVPDAAVPDLNSRPSDIWLGQVAPDSAPHDGVLRLWRAATTRGAAAVRLRHF
jgi:uncharacterized RDD family membrane protein YckC